MSRDRSVDTPRWRRLRLDIFQRDGWRCVLCGHAGRLECDHIKPREAGGALYDPDNLRSLCRTCHINETRRARVDPDVRAWSERLEQIVDER